MSKKTPVLVENLTKKLTFLYGSDAGKAACRELVPIIAAAKNKIAPNDKPLWNEKDLVLITYADGFQEKGVKTLKTLNNLLTKYVKDRISIVHILPFYPSTADRGFCPSDLYSVKTEFGTWNYIKTISKNYRLMADIILNHVSFEHIWFKKFMESDPQYENHFISFTEENLPSEEQIKMVRRGRATPLLNPYKTKNGIRYLWSTYSTAGIVDRSDLNYHNPEVLVEMIKVFLFYLEKDLKILRFDGIGGIWKELGTKCKHLPQNHMIVTMFREIMEEVSHGSLMFTETTTATFDENITYLNDKEAHVVYNFALAPHVMYSFYTGSAEKLSALAKKLDSNSETNTFFNILDIHDGINTFAAKTLLTESELQVVFDEVKARGAEFSYRTLPDGGKEIKEMHITWWSTINKDDKTPLELQLRKFITSRAIQMAIKGIPGIYYLSLLGAKNDIDYYNKTKWVRDINHTNFNYKDVAKLLDNKTSRESIIFNALMALIEERKALPAFHPNAKQQVVDLDNRLFSLVRGEKDNRVLALHNVSSEKVTIEFEGKSYTIEPYSYLWQRI